MHQQVRLQILDRIRLGIDDAAQPAGCYDFDIIFFGFLFQPVNNVFCFTDVSVHDARLQRGNGIFCHDRSWIFDLNLRKFGSSAP